MTYTKQSTVTEGSGALEVAIIGSGFSGLGLAVQLKNARIKNFKIFEKAQDIGGTWRENTYPGCACDVPSHLYSFSFAENRHWSRAFATQPEIHRYMQSVKHDHQLKEHIEFGAELQAAEFDEERAIWQLRFKNGDEVVAHNLVMGIGGLHLPNVPKFAGQESFQGQAFHSAEWPEGLDLSGKRVAVIGTGASAIQVIPAIADTVESLVSFQRSAAWVMPKPDRAYSRPERMAYQYIPGLQKLSRGLQYWRHEGRFVGFKYAKPALKLVQKGVEWHIRRQCRDAELAAKLTPDFAMGCKRVLISNDYYPALCRENVEVVTDGIREFTPNGIVTEDGQAHALDVIIYATGFKSVEAITALNIVGRNGLNLAQHWQSGGVHSYLGIQTHGFPNCYMLMGPNTGLGHNSMVFQIESQIAYVVDAIRQRQKNQWRWIDVKRGEQNRFSAKVQKALGKTVWASGCSSWYLDENGNNWTLWPGFTLVYRLLTRKFDPAVCEISTVGEHLRYRRRQRELTRVVNGLAA